MRQDLEVAIVLAAMFLVFGCVAAVTQAGCHAAGHDSFGAMDPVWCLSRGGR